MEFVGKRCHEQDERIEARTVKSEAANKQCGDHIPAPVKPGTADWGSGSNGHRGLRAAAAVPAHGACLNLNDKSRYCTHQSVWWSSTMPPILRRLVMSWAAAIVALVASAAPPGGAGRVDMARLKSADSEAGQWLTTGRDFSSSW